MTIAPFYEGWRFANESLVSVVRPLTADQLAIPIQRDWPIWASVSHIAGGRVYWLCHIFKEPGLETTPFTDPGVGWEDDPSHPRSAAELVHALDSSWAIIDRCLATWTPEMLTQTARRPVKAGVQVHTRQSVLWRMITHDAFHAGEISLALGSHGLGSDSPNGAIDLWSGLARLENVASR